MLYILQMTSEEVKNNLFTFEVRNKNLETVTDLIDGLAIRGLIENLQLSPVLDSIANLTPARYESESTSLIEWVKVNDSLIPVITVNNLCSFAAHSRPDGSLGLGIAKRIFRAAETDAAVKEYLFYDVDDQTPIGLLADKFNEFADLVSKNKIDIKGIGSFRSRFLTRYAYALAKTNS